MNSAVQKALNDQIREELYSSYLYLSMAAFFAFRGLRGFSSWMKEQASEEVKHAMRFFDFVSTHGGNVILDALAMPPSDFESPQKAFEAALEHEKFITGRIHDLHKLAGKENDVATQSMLQWFIDEQVEEEEQVQKVLDQFKTLPNGELDALLGKRGGNS
ncbi:ferritin [Candidatus Peregrinibacteria bacterium]|nr:ferritin [Candidatus Peregrinibacteria bacterium]